MPKRSGVVHLSRMGHFRHVCLRIAALFCALSVAACQGQGSNYLANGIGAELTAYDIDRATQLQETYFDHLCRQSGIGQRCNLPIHDAGSWTLVVQQGMNDIDRRCDAYLQWLDDKKRSRGPWLSQVKDVQSATSALIGIFDPSNAIALQVVAQAFNLVTRSIENYHSRLLLEIDSSTVNSVVLRARHDFRTDNSGRRFLNRPEAEYALRSYLRLCLPFAIETNINNYTTLAAQGIQLDDSNTIQPTLVGTAPLTADTAVTTRPGPSPRPWAPGGWEQVSSITIDVATGKAIQSAICLPESERDGTFGDRTKAALQIFESVQATKDIREANWRLRTVELSRADLNILRNLAACAPGARNFVENRILSPEVTLGPQLAEKIRTKFSISDASLGIPELREQIKEWRKEVGLNNDPQSMFEDQITPDLVPKMINAF